MFRYSKDKELTGEDLKNFIELHQEDVVRYDRMRNQYLTKPPILDAEPKEAWKPDARIPVNFGKYLVDTFNGFFVGKPVRVSHDEPGINDIVIDFWRSNGMDNILSETSKMTSIYGHGYWYLYQNEYARTELAYNDPRDMFIIYTDEIRPKSLYGVRYVEGEDGVDYKGVLFTADQEYEFTLAGDDLFKTEPLDDNGSPIGRLYYGRVPLIEVVENEERISLIEPVEALINTYNRVLSEKSNDVSYFADAYLKVLGAQLDKESLKTLTENRIINLAGKGTDKVVIDFMTKPNADSTQEHMLDRVKSEIYEISQVVNLNDDGLGSVSGDSGYALERKEQPMSHLALNKERKYTQALQTMFSMFFRVVTNVPAGSGDEYLGIKYNWSRNIPSNNGYEADTVKKLEGIVSKRKQLEMLSAVENVDEELERIELEGLTSEESTLEDEVATVKR